MGYVYKICSAYYTVIAKNSTSFFSNYSMQSNFNINVCCRGAGCKRHNSPAKTNAALADSFFQKLGNILDVSTAYHSKNRSKSQLLNFPQERDYFSALILVKTLEENERRDCLSSSEFHPLFSLSGLYFVYYR